MSSSPRIGLVGLGTMGTAHAKRLRAAGAEVTGADLDPDARAAFEEELGVETYADTDAMLGSVDGIVVTVPNAIHEEVTVAALEAGVDVMVEKPLAHDLASAERIADAAEASEAFCAVGFVMRYYDATQELIARCERGDLGEIEHVQATYVRRNGVPDPSRGWFTNPELAGGGALIDVGVHVLDVAMAALGFPEIEGVYADTIEQAEVDVETGANALVRCADGRSLSLDVTWDANDEPERTVTVRGADAGGTLNVSSQELRIYAGEGEPTLVDTETADWVAPEDEAFVAAVESGEPPAIGSLDQALAVQRVLDAAYRSAETGDCIRP